MTDQDRETISILAEKVMGWKACPKDWNPIENWGAAGDVLRVFQGWYGTTRGYLWFLFEHALMRGRKVPLALTPRLIVEAACEAVKAGDRG